jgi:FkbM family methyltransferase
VTNREPLDFAEIRDGIARGMWIESARGASYADGRWDRLFQLVMSELLRDGDVFYDVGAHVGFHSLVASRLVGARGRVYAFDALPEHARILEETFARNECTSCTAVGRAVGDRAGPMTFYRHNDWGGLSSAVPFDRDAFDELEVVGVTLNEFSETHASPGVIKIDVEGAEALVVAGASRLMASNAPPVFLIELHTSSAARETLEILARHHYVHVSDHDDVDVESLSPLETVRHIIAIRSDDSRRDRLVEPP